MTAIIQWRQFSFFSQEEVLSDGLSDAHLASIWKNIDVKTHSFGRGQMVFGDASGYVHLVDKNLVVSSFPAYEKYITHIVHFQQRNVIITIGYNEDSPAPLLTCWDLDRLGSDKRPVATRSIPIQSASGEEIYTVTAIAVCENTLNTAMGLSNGSVMLLKGDLVKDRYIKQKVLDFNAGKDNVASPAITGIGITENTQQNRGYGTATLYVATENSVSGYTITYSNEMREFQVLEGCKSECSGCNNKGDFIVARPEALFLYAPDGRGPCFVLDDIKTSISIFKNYAAIIGKGSKSNEENDGITIYDLRNKFIAFSAFYSDNVQFAIYAWGFFYVFTADKKIFQLTEKDTSSKLETLYNKNLFSLAINLAISSNLDETAVTDVFRRFGDHLYAKGDFDAAVEQYQQTIGKLQPSYVILKFLDAQRIHNLTSYLQKLHEKNLASADHTTLLLNCYAKMRDAAKLNDFIRRDEVFFDVDTAINVCRSAKFHEHAIYLAEKFKRNEVYIEIQLEDLQNYHEAILHIIKMNFLEAERAMKRYGKVLVSMAPEDSTKLLISLCTGTHGKSGEMRSLPEDFIHNFVNQKKWLTVFLEQYLEKDPECGQEVVWNTLFELYLSPHDVHSEVPDSFEEAKLHEKALDLLKNPNAHYNNDHVLVLCQLHQFLSGLLYLYEKNEKYQDIIQFHMDNGEYRQILSACKKYGEKSPDLWIQVLTYFAERNDDCKQEIAEVLENINSRELLSPLQVIDILSRNTSITLGLVKDFVLQQLEVETRTIEIDKNEIAKLQQETEKLEKEIEILNSNFITFQVSKCTSCSNMLELPAVHFLCKHSYHIRCLGENEKECPKCAPEQRHTLDIYKAHLSAKDEHERFFSDVSSAKDPFLTVAEYFGRNMFVDDNQNSMRSLK